MKRIENELKKAMPAVSNVMVIGDKRKFLTFLISLKTEVNLETGAPTDKLTGDALDTSKEIGSSATTLTEAATDAKWQDYVNAGMKVANNNTTSAAQKVQKFAWLPKDFSELEGDLTPTLKLKRSVVSKKYVTLIDSIYGESVQ